MSEADSSLVTAGKLDGPIIEGLFADPPAGQIDAPAVERRWGRRRAAPPQLGVADDVEHDSSLIVFVRVQRVKDVTGVDLEPTHVRVRPAPRHHAETRAILVAPPVRHR